jgi:8-oxo-dGTP pyrophosphatase MutT (NUDIX family)
MPLGAEAVRDVICDLVAGVETHDSCEAEHQGRILGWVGSGAPLFRVTSPDDPDTHLAVYFALFDEADRSVMLVNHRKAGLWLLPGGHVDADEDPRRTVVREAEEELAISAQFHGGLGSDPFFLSVTRTRGHGSHTDVTLWFVLAASRTDEVRPDPVEFSELRWVTLDELLTWDAGRLDPHMHRFTSKLMARLGEPALAR